MNGNALHILNMTSKAILDAELNENSARERKQTEPFVDIYPCSCGHCPSCGVQVLETITPEEVAELDRASEEEAMRWEEIDGEWFKVW